MKKHLWNFAWMIGIAVVFFYVIISIFEVQVVLQQFIIGGTITFSPGLTVDAWLKDFQLWAGVGIIGALLMSILWYILAQWVFRVNNLSDAGKRGVWFLLMIISLVALIPAFILTKQVRSGMAVAYALYVLNVLLCYYFATVFFSPAAHKYVPPLADVLRR